MNEIELSNYKILHKYKTLGVFSVNKTYVRQTFVCVSRSVVSDSRDPMDCNPPDSSLCGFLHTRILKCVVIPFSRGSS